MSRKSILSNRALNTGLWFLFHLSIFLLFSFSLLKGGLDVSSDLMQMIPDTSALDFGKADERLTEINGRKIFVLSYSSDFGKAKEGAEKLGEELKGSGKFEAIDVLQNTFSFDEIEDFIFKNRFVLADIKDSEALVFANNALAKIFGAFTLSSLERLDEDPFLLQESVIEKYMAALKNSGSKLGPKDGMLATEYEGNWYVLCTLSLTKEAALMASKNNGVSLLYNTVSSLEGKGYSFVMTGTPLHSFESSTSASKEISVISTISMLLVVLMLLFVFRSFTPLVCSLCSIVLSVLVAFSATHFVFSSVHMLTLIFGTSLIGSCIDYNLHFFIRWKADASLKSSWEVREHLFKGLILSLLSTEICYIMLFFAPFAILKQMAVFSFVGILSSFLTSACAFPNIKIQEKKKRKIFIIDYFCKLKRKSLIKWLSRGLLLFSLIVIALNWNKIQIKNNIANLYKMKGRLKDDTILSAKAMGYTNPYWFIVKGKNSEELLQNEEKVLASLKKQGFTSFLATSLFVPSQKSQQENYEECKKLLPLAESQLDFLGFDSSAKDLYEQSFEKSQGRFVNLEVADLPQTLRKSLENLYLGKLGENYFSIIMLSSSDSIPVLDEMKNVFFENKAVDISLGLDHLTKFILKMFAISYFIIVLVLKFFYSWKDCLRIAFVPVKSLLLIAAVFLLMGKNIDFFCIIGMVLVFGLGLDYIIYMTENSKKAGESSSDLESFAIFLSFFTTALSFGALALSSFVPVHVMGLSILLGLTAAYLASADENQNYNSFY